MILIEVGDIILPILVLNWVYFCSFTKFQRRIVVKFAFYVPLEQVRFMLISEIKQIKDVIKEDETFKNMQFFLLIISFSSWFENADHSIKIPTYVNTDIKIWIAP